VDHHRVVACLRTRTHRYASLLFVLFWSCSLGCISQLLSGCAGGMLMRRCSGERMKGACVVVEGVGERWRAWSEMEKRGRREHETASGRLHLSRHPLVSVFSTYLIALSPWTRRPAARRSTPPSRGDSRRADTTRAYRQGNRDRVAVAGLDPQPRRRPQAAASAGLLELGGAEGRCSTHPSSLWPAPQAGNSARVKPVGWRARGADTPQLIGVQQGWWERPAVAT